MPSRVRIGPSDGPYAVVDERDGRLVFEVPEDKIDFDANDVENLGEVNGVIVENHNQRHESGGADELSVTGLSGDLEDPQDAKAHSESHESGGVDEISVAGLSGDLADAQDPKAHSETHGFEGADELATALRYEPEAEPATPTSGCVRWYDETEAAYKAKFDDGETVTLAEK